MQVATDVMYRYEDVMYASMLDEYDEPLGPGRLSIVLREYSIIKRTPKGTWIYTGNRRFVLNEGRKRFALPTKELAMESFLARKRRQLSIHRHAVARAEKAIALATKTDYLTLIGA